VSHLNLLHIAENIFYVRSLHCDRFLEVLPLVGRTSWRHSALHSLCFNLGQYIDYPDYESCWFSCFPSNMFRYDALNRVMIASLCCAPSYVLILPIVDVTLSL